MNVTRTAGRRPARPWYVELASGMTALQLALDWFRHDTALRRSRMALAELSDEQLRDVGLTRRQATEEARRSFSFD